MHKLAPVCKPLYALLFVSQIVLEVLGGLTPADPAMNATRRREFKAIRAQLQH